MTKSQSLGQEADSFMIILEILLDRDKEDAVDPE